VDTWILQMIRRTAQRQIAVWVVVLAILVGVAMSNRTYIKGFFQGPRKLEAAQLDSLDDPDGTAAYYVTVTGTRAVETGVQEIEIRTTNGIETGRSVSSNYVALDMGPRFLIVKTAASQPTSVVGELGPMPEDFVSKFFETKEMQAIRNTRFYPFMLDTVPFQRAGYIWIAVTVVLLALFAWKGVPALRDAREPELHPLAQRVIQWGDPIGTAAAIEREWHSPPVKKTRGWKVTENYLIQTAFFAFNVHRFADLLWAYKHITKHSVNFIPTGKTYAAHMHFQSGFAQVTGGELVINNLLQLMSQKAPWAVLGWSAELAQRFNKRNAEFRAAVAARKKEQATPR
jgi:hypothetical protein